MSWTFAGPALLFCPGDRPDRFAKAAAAADAVILDLEDGVAAADKPAARVAVAGSRLDPTRTVVRVNPVPTPEHELDIDAVRASPYTTVMVAKAESADQVALLAPFDVIALCETPKGVLGAEAIAACANTVGMMWGAEDLVAALGGRSSRHGDGTYRQVVRHTRSHVLLAAASHQVPAIDAVHLDIADVVGLAAEAGDAAASGFVATACIHPSQVPVVRDAYRPADSDIDWARRVLQAAGSQRGVFTFEGQMVDAPVLRHAEHILRRAAASGVSG